MLSFAAYSLLGLSAFASALPQKFPTLHRRSGCGYSPNETLASGLRFSSPPFLLRIQDPTSNTTLGYLDAFRADWATVGPRASAATTFLAPSFNGDGSLIFWAGANGTDRGFTASDDSLANSSSVDPVGVNGCGTDPVYFFETGNGDHGSCGYDGFGINVHFRCPIPGTTNDTPAPCWAQTYFGEEALLVLRSWKIFR